MKFDRRLLDIASPVLLGFLFAPSTVEALATATPQSITATSSQSDVTQSEQAPAISKADMTNVRLPALTAVEIETVDSVDSKSAKLGDTFAIRLVEPVRINGTLVLPVGTIGKGEVTHVAKAGWGGKAGELIVTARFLQCGNLRIPLGHFHFGASGEAHVGAAFGASMIVPLAGLLGSRLVHSQKATAAASATADW